MDEYLILYRKRRGGPLHNAFVRGNSARHARGLFELSHQHVEILSVWREVGGW